MRRVLLRSYSILIIVNCLICLSGCNVVADNTNYFDESTQADTEEITKSEVQKALDSVGEKAHNFAEDFDYNQQSEYLPKSVYEYDVKRFVEDNEDEKEKENEDEEGTLKETWNSLWR